MVFIGIDPGLTGAIAFIIDKRYLVFDTPIIDIGKGVMRCEPGQMSLLLRTHVPPIQDRVATIEQAQSAPDQDRAGLFRYGIGYGMWLGVLAAEMITTTEPRPQEWMARIFGSRRDKGVNLKKRSLMKARELFPFAPLNLEKHHGRAEALLIAYSTRMAYGD